MHLNQRTIRTLWKQWRASLIGLAIGLIYGILSQMLDIEAMHAPRVFIWLDNLVSVVFPGIFGILAGLVYNHVRWQTRINRTLSTVNAQLQRHVLTQTLSAHILHEVRNPLHNLTAVLESWQERLPTEDVAILQRNLNRLHTVTNQLSRWTASDDEINLREPVHLATWLEEFLIDKVRPRLRDSDISFQQEIDFLIVHMHPLLLEQCFTMLFNNALEAVSFDRNLPTISLAAQLSTTQEGYVEVQLCNSGRQYPQEVLSRQGREPVDSQRGLGLGLVLVRRSLELVGGSLQLANDAGRATTMLWIPGHPQ